MKLIEYEDNYFEDVKNYVLTDEMTYYTSLPKENIDLSQNNPDYHSILAYSASTLVTFFVLDAGVDKKLYTEEPQSMLLRSFSTDSRYVRQGHAKEALKLLPNFVKIAYPDIQSIVLAVNAKNHSAQNLYIKSGFKDEGVRRMGEKGELIVLQLSVK